MGAGKGGHDAKAKGTKYYFSDTALLAIMTGGKASDKLDDKMRATAEKLQRESKAFREAAK